MIAYTIYIIGSRKFLPQEGKGKQHFQRDGYKDARNYLVAKFASASAASSASTSAPSAASTSSSISISVSSSSTSSILCHNAAAAVLSSEDLSFIDTTEETSSFSTPPLLCQISASASAADHCNSDSSSSAAGIASSSSAASTSPPQQHQGSKILGFEKAAFLHGHFYFNIYKEGEKGKLDEMWLKPVIQIGEVVAGDEKLYHYTAHHMNTKAVPQKKDVSSFFFVEFRAQNEREMIVFSN